MSDDRPSRLERLATAVATSNLTLDLERRTPIDHVIALGMASRSSSVTSDMLHLYLVGSPEAWHAAKSSVMSVVLDLNAKRRWGLDERSLDKVATDSLLMHLNPTCSHCKGRGYLVQPGTPSLSHKACPHCKGDGRRPLNKKLRTQIATTLSSLERIDSLTEAAVSRILR